MEPTEKVANSKTNVLDFGNDDTIFYRGEIHIIKMIGHNEGVFSSKFARKFGITRAVVHKTVLTLENRGLVIKKKGESDQRKVQLYLTPKGKLAYEHHEKYHDTYDKELFPYISELSESELKVTLNYFIEP